MTHLPLSLLDHLVVLSEEIFFFFNIEWLHERAFVCLLEEEILLHLTLLSIELVVEGGEVILLSDLPVFFDHSFSVCGHSV